MSMSTRLEPVIPMLNRFAGWLLFIAIGWLAWTAARLLWLLLAPPIAPALPDVALQSSANVAVDNSSLFTIFAEPEAAVAAVQPPPNIILKGVLLAIPESLSSALLDINGEVKNYRINDSLQDSGYTLVAVDWNAVVIADASDKQTVISMADSMPLDQTGMAANAIGNQRLSNNNTANNITNNAASALPLALPDEPSAMAENNADTSNPSNQSNPSPIEEAITELQDNPSGYLSRMGVMATGEGYQVTAAMPSQVRNRLGLEPGDKVLTVNGQTVGNNPTQDAGVLQQVKQAGEAQIEVQRGDQVITIRQQF